VSSWRDTLTEDRYATWGLLQLRARRGRLSQGLLADDFQLPEEVAVETEPHLSIRGDASALFRLADELDKLGRSPSGSSARIADRLLLVSNDLESPLVSGTTRLPWYLWNTLAHLCRELATYGSMTNVSLDSTWAFDGRSGQPQDHYPVAGQRVDLIRTGPSCRELEADADELHKARQRGMAPYSEVTDTDLVVELQVPWYPSPGAPEVRLWVDRSSRHETVLVYAAGPLAKAGATFVVVHFPECSFVMLGGPGHNGHHPLEARGLHLYGVYEVLNSSLYDRRANVGPEKPELRSGSPGRSRHFVITFHDETFECFAKDIVGEFTSDLANTVAALPTK
jgi:hypothetical protein